MRERTARYLDRVGVYNTSGSKLCRTNRAGPCRGTTPLTPTLTLTLTLTMRMLYFDAVHLARGPLTHYSRRQKGEELPSSRVWKCLVSRSRYTFSEFENRCELLRINEFRDVSVN